MFGDEFIKFKLMRPGAIIPKRATDGSGAFDFFSPEDGFLDPGEKRLFPSGVAHDMPGELFVHLHPYAQSTFEAVVVPFRMQGVLFDRSGLGGKKNIRISFASLIDNDYRGEILLSLENHGPDPFFWRQGDRLCQIAYVLMYAGNAAETRELSETGRGAGGFGSTGR